MDIYIYPRNRFKDIVEIIRVTKITGSSSDDWVYYYYKFS
jgi:hypothetical protein